MRTTRRLSLLAAAVTAVTVLTVPSTAAAVPAPASAGHRTHLLASGLRGTVGSTVGPDGALYVAESAAGRISRVDPRTGHVTTFATGLPKRIGDLGGAMDVVFVHRTPYVLVTLVSPDVGGTDIDGIYRMDGPDHFTVVADIGAWSLTHPPISEFFIPTGVQFALQWYRGAFLVTDGHHNRVLRVTLDGEISERIAFPDIVPTGLAVRGRTVYLAEAGPVPHLPQSGKVVSFGPGSRRVTEVASGAPLLVDVEFGRGGTLYALSQGHFTPGNPEGSPADPGTGAVERIHRDGTMTPVVSGLDRPASLEFIGDTGYVLTLTGEIWTIERVSRRATEHR
jgi:sugar lactone lactonase YvrE